MQFKFINCYFRISQVTFTSQTTPFLAKCKSDKDLLMTVTDLTFRPEPVNIRETAELNITAEVKQAVEPPITMSTKVFFRNQDGSATEMKVCITRDLTIPMGSCVYKDLCRDLVTLPVDFKPFFSCSSRMENTTSSCDFCNLKKGTLSWTIRLDLWKQKTTEFFIPDGKYKMQVEFFAYVKQEIREGDVTSFGGKRRIGCFELDILFIKK